MIDQGSVPSLMGSTVRDSAGDKIGKVGQVYLDDTTGQPEWVTVRTGLFGTRESFVPLAAARVEGDELVVDVPKDRVTAAPKIDEDGHLSEEQEAELYSYYEVSPGAFGQDTDPTGYPATDAGADQTTDAPYAQTGTAGPTPDDAGTRPEEQLPAGMQRPEAGRARLRRYLGTERVELDDDSGTGRDR
jgi:sporulation protein YlmC with PRC-barrel domain